MRERGGEGDRLLNRFRIGYVREREAVRERIIKNCKRMNILLNKCVE